MRNGPCIWLLAICCAHAATALGQTTHGTLVDTVACQAHPGQHYALYLPPGYTPDKRWPTLYFFEPMARGGLPVKKYAPIAAELGYILVGSHHARNGSWPTVFDAAEALLADTRQRYAIDTTALFTAGFSGGARAAMAVAVAYNNIAGVVACAGGYPDLPEYQPTASDRFWYAGIVGDRDMNYLEHHDVEQKLGALRIPNRRVVFQGRHAWPPAACFQEALAWIGWQRTKARMGPSAPAHEHLPYFMGLARALEANGQPGEAARHYAYIARDFADHADVAEATAKAASLANTKTAQKNAKAEARALKHERRTQQTLFAAFAEMRRTQLKATADSTAKDIGWWHAQIDLLRRQAHGRKGAAGRAAERLLNLVWASCAERCWKYMEWRDYRMARLTASLWVYATPNSPWARWNLAKAEALLGNAPEAMAQLEEAHRNGMKRLAALANEPAFGLLKDLPRYNALCQKLAQSPQE